MLEILSCVEYKGYWYTIHPDAEPDDPRKWDNLGTMVCAHNRYQLGDRMIGGKGVVSYADTPMGFQRWLFSEGKKGNLIFMPLYLYDHGGISISTDTFYGRAPHAEWDSGLVGYIYATRDEIKRQFHWTNLTSKRKNIVLDALEQEVKTYDQYLQGDCYGFQVWRTNPLDEDGDWLDEDELELLDSSWGYYGIETAVLDAISSIDLEIRQELKRGLQLTLPNVEEYLSEQVRIEGEKLDTATE